MEVSLLWRLYSTVTIALVPEMVSLIHRFFKYGGSTVLSYMYMYTLNYYMYM